MSIAFTSLFNEVLLCPPSSASFGVTTSAVLPESFKILLGAAGLGAFAFAAASFLAFA